MHIALGDWAIIILFLIISFGIGIYFTKTASKGLSAFFLGGRNLTWWVAGVSMVATTFAADTPLAVTELVAKDGIAGNWIWWTFLAGGMLTTFFFARLWRRSGVMTDVEFIELRYSGKPAAFLRGFKSIYLGLFMNCLIIGWVNLALISIFQVFFEIPKSEAMIYVALAMIITMIYSGLSGLLGVAINDFVQFFIAMTGTIILSFLVVSSEAIGGVDGLKTKLADIAPGALNFFPEISDAAQMGQTLTLSLGAFLAIAGFQWWSSWYPGAEPGGGGYIAQRMLSTKNEKHAIVATLFFQVAHYCLRPWPWIIVGLCSLVLYPELGASEKRLGYVMAMKDFLPTGLKGLLLVAFLSAYMSTISTQLNWGASYLVNDFYNRFITSEKDFINEDVANKNYTFISRLTTLFIMVLALIITGFLETISGVWVFIIEAGAGLGLVLILRWYWWRINAWSEIAATAIPLLVLAFLKISHYYTDVNQESAFSSFIIKYNTYPYSFFFILIATTLGWLLITFITSPTEQSHLREFYAKIKPQGFWKPIRKSMAIEEKSTYLIFLLICWLFSIVFCYSILFLIGKIIFKEWTNVLILSAVTIVSGSVVAFIAQKIKIFED